MHSAELWLSTVGWETLKVTNCNCQY